MIRVKICGVNSASALEAASEAGADWVGFVFFARSPRALTPAQAEALWATRPANAPPPVGLFVQPSDAQIAAALSVVPLAALQIYAPLERALELGARFASPVWHACGVTTPTELPVAAHGLDALVVEPKPPPGADRPGGNGVALDWAMLAGWQAPVPWLLAGGLTPATVATAIAASGATAVDVSSGVESAPGIKDAALIRAFVAAARGLPATRETALLP